MVTSPGVVSDIVGGKKWIPLSDVEGMSPALRGDGGRVWGRGAESSLRPRFPHWININQLCRGGGLEDRSRCVQSWPPRGSIIYISILKLIP